MEGILDESSQKAVLNVLDESTKMLLQEISDNDPNRKAIAKSILAMPERIGKTKC